MTGPIFDSGKIQSFHLPKKNLMDFERELQNLTPEEIAELQV